LWFFGGDLFMASFRKIALYGVMLSFVLSLGSVATADTLVLTFVNGTATAAKPGACSGIPWINGAEFRMCNPSGTLGGGAPLQKSSINGGETYTFTNGVLTAVTGTPGNPGATSPPSPAAPTAGTNTAWQQDANFFSVPFNFLAPYSGSLAGNYYGNATYIGGIPSAGNNIPFIFAPVLEAQWGNTYFPLGQSQAAGGDGGLDNALGITFTAEITNVVTSGNTVTFDFHMYANERIDTAEDPGSAGFSDWTAQWHQQGSGTYTDTTPPTVSSTNPTDGASGISPSLTAISVTFSESMDPASITAGAITLSGGETVGAPTASNQNKTFTFPITSSPLTVFTAYTITFNAGPTDAGGNALTLPAAKTFNTGTDDLIPPTITGRSPASGATGILVTTPIVVTFSEAMDAGTANAITVKRTSDNAPVAGTVAPSAGNTVFTFSPSADLADGTQYTVTVAGATAKDTSNNALGADDIWSFTTAGIVTTTQPVLESNGKGNGLLAGCTINPRATFDPTLLSMLLGSFGYLAWRRRRSKS
jgi:hypothetical protein